MRSYELMTIHRPELSEEDVRSLISGVENFLGDRVDPTIEENQLTNVCAHLTLA